jgi:hypothetical protein
MYLSLCKSVILPSTAAASSVVKVVLRERIQRLIGSISR